MDNEEAKDALARLAATTDQAIASMPTIAALTASYFKALLAAGFERGEALTLTRDYWAAILK